jgi:hypothetical protein
MTDEEVLYNRNDLEMMLRVHLWPGGDPEKLSTLCLKNPRLAEGLGNWPKFAMLYWDGRAYSFILSQSFPGEIRSGGPELPAALVAEGWLVD